MPSNWREGRSTGIKAATAQHVAALASASTPAEIESAFQAALNDLGRYRSSRHRPIHAAMVARGLELCAAHPRGGFVPRFGAGRRLHVRGEVYRVGRGQNSTGVRYVWAYAERWARARMEDGGLSITASKRVWGSWSDYPHRALRVIEEFDAGKHRDPVMNTLIRQPDSRGPIRCEIGEDQDRRAHRPCECGGTLFDWGCGWSSRIIPLEWRCNRCSAVFIEYVSDERLRAIRTPSHPAGAA
ncbi:hypothetical protein [Methylobacterium sp. sgz302541]|uniref:hypothetical protein n=1 Tax=unclassified Methylobacterium TaxID=2615210 RepID=UPI003D354E69